MATRKYGARFINALPNHTADPITLVGDVVLPYITVANVEVPLPCGADEVVEALKAKDVTISVPKEGSYKALLEELVTGIAPLATKVQEMTTKATSKSKR